MPPKSSKLQALIDKKKTKNAGAKGKASDQQTEQTEQHVDEVPAQQQEQEATEDTAKGKPTAPQNEDSDGSDDDDLKAGGEYLASIKDKDVRRAPAEEEKAKDPYGLENQATQDGAGPTSKQSNRPRNAADITFGSGRPKFSNKNRNQIASDFVSLNELEQEEGGRKNKKNEKKAAVAEEPKRAPEEEKATQEHKPVKPTFRGKLDLTKTGDGGGEQTKAGSTSYGFTVKYKSDNPDKEERKDKEGEKDAQKPDTRRDRRNKDRGQRFDAFNKSNKFGNEAEEDGFEVVTDKKNDRRKKKTFNKKDSDDSDSDNNGGFTVNRGGRGRGRGGGNFGFERAANRAEN